MSMEIRGHITIPAVPVDREDLWGPLIEHLERGSARHLGAVLSWDSATDAVVVMSTDAATRAEAAATFVSAVVDALQATGVDSYPIAVQLESGDVEPAVA